MSSIFTNLFSSVTGKISMFVIVGLLSVLGVFFYLWHSSQSKIDTLTKENSALVVSNKALDTTNKQLKVSSDISDKVQAEAVTEKASAVAKTNKVTAKVEQKVADINVKYGSKDLTEEQKKNKSDEISEARLDGMLDVFCIADPNAKQCTVEKK